MGNAGKRYKETSEIKKEIVLRNDYNIEELGEANVYIKIAQWRAKDTIENKRYKDLPMNARLILCKLVTLLQGESKLLVNPEDEIGVISYYNNPELFCKKYNSQVIDIFLEEEMMQVQYVHKMAYEFRRKIFPYLPSYEPKTQ